MIQRRMARRRLFHVGSAALAGALLGLLPAGCSSKKTKGRSRRGDNRDPSRFGSLLMDSYIKDLKQGPVSKQISAANELANMGSKAKSALPLLEKLSKNPDEKLSSAAKTAIASIKRAK